MTGPVRARGLRAVIVSAAAALLGGCIVGGGVGSGGGGIGLGFGTFDYAGTAVGIGIGSRSGISIGAATGIGSGTFGPSGEGARPQPASSDEWLPRDGIAAFGDRFIDLTPAEIVFASSRFAGARGVTASQSARLHAAQPRFLVLDERLIAGLGDNTLVIEGDTRVPDSLGPDFVGASWAYALPGNPAPVRYIPGDWTLMDLDDAGWRTFFTDRVQSMRSANGSDGLLLMQADLPALFAEPGWQPALPTADPDFAEAWNERVRRFIAFLQERGTSDGPIVAEVGSWISPATEADPFDWADGLWVDAFAADRSGRPLNEDAWRRQLGRVLRATGRGQAVVLATPATDADTLMFVAGSYLLVRGPASYLSARGADGALWPPVYAIPVPPQAEPLADGIAGYDPDGDGVYARRFGNATVYVHPRSTNGLRGPVTVSLGGTRYLAVPEGSGQVGADGTADVRVSYRPVQSLTLPPSTAVIVFERPPAGEGVG